MIASYNCRNFKADIIDNLLLDLSKEGSSVVLCLQETWRYELPSTFVRKYSNEFVFLHESAMNINEPRRKGRPYGGVCIILSKNIAYEIIYNNSCCLSIFLTDRNVLLNNVYLPYNDKRISVESNNKNMMEAIGHLNAAHQLARGACSYITIGDFNVAPTDHTERSVCVNEFMKSHNYIDTDLMYYSANEFSHESGRLIDRIITSPDLTDSIENISIDKQYQSSDHYPVMGKLLLPVTPPTTHADTKTYILWEKASQNALKSYSQLVNKRCTKTLHNFIEQKINGPELYDELVNNLEEAATACIPKSKLHTASKHCIPLWKERMSIYRHKVDILLQLQFLNGGPKFCGAILRQHLMMAKSEYRRQLRILRRELHEKLAEHITTKNCFNVLFKKQKPSLPTTINGYSRETQPVMWRQHFKTVFKAEDTPYNGNIFDIIDNKIDFNVMQCFDFDIFDINNAIIDIKTNKSYTRHNHWKYLHGQSHSAKLCLSAVFKSWSKNILNNEENLIWKLFDTNLNPKPKTNKKDLTAVTSWRPISIGTSENWILEKIFLSKLKSYLQTDDSQFGYKKNHSSCHAIEIVRTLERSYDAHVCLLDASAAFDNLSWFRVRDQLLKRNIPICLLKLVLKQLISNRISVCSSSFIYPRKGTKQGGVLSGQLFSACYDDLVNELKTTGSGILFETSSGKFTLLSVLIYADDVLLMARSPGGLKALINKTLLFASFYDDISFNPLKSWILRLGPHNKPPVSVCGISTTECQQYLGVSIGRQGRPQLN